jgi:hypothetical protein
VTFIGKLSELRCQNICRGELFPLQLGNSAVLLLGTEEIKSVNYRFKDKRQIIPVLH